MTRETKLPSSENKETTPSDNPLLSGDEMALQNDMNLLSQFVQNTMWKECRIAMNELGVESLEELTLDQALTILDRMWQAKDKGLRRVGITSNNEPTT